MSRSHCNTIIVGGGIAGLACARTLSDGGEEDFLLITKDVGGRIHSSDDGTINYGAIYVASNYRHINRYVARIPRGAKRLFLESDGRVMKASSVIFRHPIQFVRLLALSTRFYFAYRRFQKRTVDISQKEAIESDSFLHMLYNAPAEEFIQKHNIEDISYELVDFFLYGITISDIREQNAFTMMLMCLVFFVRVWEYRFDADSFTLPFRSRIAIDEVVSVNRCENNSYYCIHTKSGREFTAENVVVATPLNVSQSLLGLRYKKFGRVVYVFHLSGQLKKKYPKKLGLFLLDSPVFGILEQHDGSYLLYATKSAPNIERFFEHYEVVASTCWDPIYPVIGDEIIDARQGENLWMIGDYNVVGLEDSFITGVYAARKIIEKQAKSK